MESNTVMNVLTGSYDYHGQWIISDSPNHEHVHDGTFFSASRTTSALGASSYIDFELIPPSSATVLIHLKEIYVNNSGGLCQMLLYEATTNGSTHTAGGSTSTKINHSRNSTKTSSLGLAQTVTNLPSATTVTSTQYLLILNEYIGSTGSQAFNTGKFFESKNELNLKYATKYVLRLLDASAGGAATLKMFWYETTRVF